MKQNTLITQHLPLLHTMIEKEVEVCQNTGSGMQKNADSIWDFWLHEQAEADTVDGNLKKESVLKAIKEHKRMWKPFKNLRAVFGPKEFGSLMSL